MATGKKPELPQRQDGVSDSPVYEFDLQRSSGRAPLGMYMSFRNAVQKWRQPLPDRGEDALSTIVSDKGGRSRGTCADLQAHMKTEATDFNHRCFL